MEYIISLQYALLIVTNSPRLLSGTPEEENNLEAWLQKRQMPWPPRPVGLVWSWPHLPVSPLALALSWRPLNVLLVTPSCLCMSLQGRPGPLLEMSPSQRCGSGETLGSSAGGLWPVLLQGLLHIRTGIAAVSSHPSSKRGEFFLPLAPAQAGLTHWACSTDVCWMNEDGLRPFSVSDFVSLGDFYLESLINQGNHHYIAIKKKKNALLLSSLLLSCPLSIPSCNTPGGCTQTRFWS